MVVFASAAKPPTTTTREAEEKNEKNAWHVSISVLGGGRNSRGKKEKEEEEDVEARNGGFSRVRHESTLKAVLALATKRDDDETDENLVRREEEEEEEEETEKTLSARFSAEDFARKRDVILISVCSSGVGGGEGSFVSSSFSSPSPTHSHSWSASSAMYEFAAKAKASSSCGGSESVSMQCNRAEFLEIDGGGKREKADAYDRAMVSETGVKSRDVLASSALRRLSEELACFSERSAERFGEGKVSSSRDTGEIEVAYAEICGMAALDGLDATKRKKIERFVEKKIEDVLERVGALGVIMVVAQAREENEIVESQRRRRALLQENDSSEDGRSAKEYPNKAAATIVGFILLLGAVAGFLAMLTMPFPTDSLLFPKTKGD